MEEKNFNLLEHLLERGHGPNNKTKVAIDENLNLATFFLYNLSGQIVGYQRYNPFGKKKLRDSNNEDNVNKRYYTTVPSKEIALWGMETYEWKKEYVFIGEGIFDMVKVHNAGYPALALLTKNCNKPLKGWLKTIPQKIIGIGDNDENGSGLAIANVCDYFYKTPDPYKDLGEMEQEKVNAFLKSILKKI